MHDDLTDLDTVQTPEGVAVIVGFLRERGEVEVRYPNRNLRLWPISQVSKVDGQTPAPVPDEAPAPSLSFTEAREQGIAPPVDLAQFGDLGGPAPAANPDAKPTSTLAKRVSSGGGVPTGKDGKPLKGIALRNALAKQEREA